MRCRTTWLLLGAGALGSVACTASDGAPNDGPEASGGDGGADAGATTGGGAGLDGGTSSAPDAGCGSLSDRVRTTMVSVTATVRSDLPIMLCPQSDGQSQVAWTDSSVVHVTPLDTSDQRRADDMTVSGEEVRGLVANADGAAVLVRQGDEMSLVRLGETSFDTGLVGGNSHGAEGDRWIDDWPHEGRLLWDGSNYTAYFGCTANWGSIGSHQQDYAWVCSGSGAVEATPGMYDWKCGHSEDLRIAYNGAAVVTACLSDCNYDLEGNPHPGVYVDGARVLPATGNCAGSVDALLGGLVAESDGSWISFAAPNGAEYDVGMVFIPSNGGAGAVEWLTNTPGVRETAPHLARYGGNLLAGWHEEGGATKLAVVSLAGEILDGPVDIAPELPSGGDFVIFPDGDVGWAGAWGSSSELEVVRVAFCEG